MRDLAFTGFIILALYHLLILVGIINPDYVWGGNIDSLSKKILLELIALIIIISMIYIVDSLKKKKYSNFIKVGLYYGFTFWIISFIGNLFSVYYIEKIVGSSIALFYIIYFYIEINQYKILKKEKV